MTYIHFMLNPLVYDVESASFALLGTYYNMNEQILKLTV